MGAMPRASKRNGVNRLTPGDAPRPAGSALARSIGLAHQVTMRLSSAAVAMLARPIRPSLTASQRVRVTLWFHASRNVPASISRVTSGAPQKIPMRAGVARSNALVKPKTHL
jgi:hypothetical protein